MLGVANGIGGTQITLGDAKMGADTLHEVSNPNNRFRLYLRSIETDAYTISNPQRLGLVDTSNTTATVDTSLFKIDFTSGEIFQSNVIQYRDGLTINNARIVLPDNNLVLSTGAGSTFPMTFPLTFSGGDTVELSADNGSNWETVSALNTTHTFTNTGEKLLMRITVGGTRYIKVRDSIGGDTPIEVFINENI